MRIILPKPAFFSRSERDSLDDPQRAFWRSSVPLLDDGEYPDFTPGEGMISADQREWLEELVAGLVKKHWNVIREGRREAFFEEANKIARNLPQFYDHKSDQKNVFTERLMLTVDEIPAAAKIWIKCGRRRWTEERYNSYVSQRFIDFSSELSEIVGEFENLESGLTDTQIKKLMLLVDTLCLEICEFTLDMDAGVCEELKTRVLELHAMVLARS